MANRAGGMSGHVLQGAPPVPLVLRKSARARRITLRVSAVDGQVTVTMPRYASERQALEFAELKADWIRGHVSKHRGQTIVEAGNEIFVDGCARQICVIDAQHVQLWPDAIGVPSSAVHVGRTVEGWLKTHARHRFNKVINNYSDMLGTSPAALSLRDTRSRWGSCTSEGRIMMSWRLAMAPRNVQEYVAAHEAAHLVEMNHSSAFWSLVERIYGDHKKPRQWLRDKGIELHRYKFRV